MRLSVAHLAAVAVVCALPVAVQAAPVDLSGWTAEGSAHNWIVAGDNNSVLQTVNGAPTVFHNNSDSQGKKLSGTISVGNNWDDDYIGFVLGYNAGDLASTATDFILVDWKKGNQNWSNWGVGQTGLSISHVSSRLLEDRGAWAHDSAYGVTELERATTLGSTGWANNTVYSFDLTFTSSLIEVFVNGSKELSITGSFADGSFGFYNFSQENVTYAGIEEDDLPPSAIPVPAALPLLGGGLAMLGLLRRKRRNA